MPVDGSVLQLPEAMVEPEERPPSEEDIQAVAASRQYFRQNHGAASVAVSSRLTPS